MTTKASDSGKPICAVCRKRPVVAAYKPFCSKRCAGIDLGRWLGGAYRVPGEPASSDELDTAGPGDDA